MIIDNPIFEVTPIKPFRLRKDDQVPWQQFTLLTIASTVPGIREGISALIIQHITNSTSTVHYASGPGFSYKFKNPPEMYAIAETMLLDEVSKKLYFIHSPNFDSNFIIREATVEIKNESNASRTVTDIHSIRIFSGSLGFEPCVGNMIQWFLNPLDGSIFQIHTLPQIDDGDRSCTTFHNISWVKLDDSVQIDAPYSDVPYAGKVKLMSKSAQVKFHRGNISDPFEYGILFSKDGLKMLMRFRMCNPEWLNYTSETSNAKAEIKNAMTSPDSLLTHQRTKPPTYALFVLDYDSHSIELLTQFVPSSVENHCNLLISTRLLPVYANGIGFPNSAARSFLSQRSHMIGKYLKYTFFSTIHKEAIGIVAVKSLMKTLQTAHFSSTPKKVWFPLEDDKFKMAFENLSEKSIKWKMLAQKHNVMYVIGKEFILQIYPSDIEAKQLGTIRVKLGVEYKDYRKCARCAKMEEHKCRSKNGRRISQFKVCGWCKDHNFHKMWWEIPCHYCSGECADNHWPIHQLEHNKKHKGKKKSKK